MIANNPLLNLATANTEQSVKPKWSANVKADSSFESFMNQTTKSTSSISDRTDKAVNRQDNKQSVKKDDTQSKRTEKDTTRSDSVKNEEPQEAASASKQTEKTKVTESATDSKPQEAGPNDEKTLKDLSDALGISEESILQILNSLNMTLSDLANNDNLSLFMQQVYDVSSPGQLLQVPNIKTVFEDVRQLMAQYEDTSYVQTSAHSEAAADSSIALSDTTASSSMLDTDAQSSDDNLTDGEPELFQLQQQSTAAATESKSEASTAPTDHLPTQAATHLEAAATDQIDDPSLVNMAAHISEGNDYAYTSSLTTKTEATRNVNTQDVIKQITENIKVDVRNNISEVRISLRPEHLGDVTLKVATENGIITAQFIAESQRVKEIIEANFNQLKDTLQQQGIQLSALSVSVGQDTNQERMDSFLRNQQDVRTRVRQVASISEAEAAATEEIDIADPWQEAGSQVNYTA